jgi:hypothetical protein
LQWTSDHYNFIIQFKRLQMLQDRVRTLALTDGSNSRNKKKKKDKQPSWLQVPGIPSLLADQKAMWVQYKKDSDPDRPVAPPEGYKGNDEDISGIDGNNNGGCFSSDESRKANPISVRKQRQWIASTAL